MKTLKLFIYVFLLQAALFFSACQKDSQEIKETPKTETNDLVQFQNGDPVPGQYIVVYKDEFIKTLKALNKKEHTLQEFDRIMKDETVKILTEINIPKESIVYSYGAAINGFTGKLSASDASLLVKDDRIAYVEQDHFIVLGKPVKNGGSSQPNQVTPWGITRVGNYTDESDNTHVAWIIDTGIDLDHPDLNVDVSKCKSFISNSDPNDQNGHGTHVAGIIGAKNNSIGVVGVAAGCKVVAVRVLGANGSGTISGVIAGINYVAANGTAGDVANMSLGGGAYQSLDDAVKNAASLGIYFAVAAGNDGSNANNYSPARANGTNIYTISAMNNKDIWASWSNYANPPVDYCAPGVSIFSTYKDGSYATLSGTSMATPHVTGLLLVTNGHLATDGYVTNDPDKNPDPIAHK